MWRTMPVRNRGDAHLPTIRTLIITDHPIGTGTSARHANHTVAYTGRRTLTLREKTRQATYAVSQSRRGFHQPLTFVDSGAQPAFSALRPLGRPNLKEFQSFGPRIGGISQV